MSVRVDPAATIHIVFTVGHAHTTDYSLTEDGAPDGRGHFARLLHIAYRKPGQATLTISISTGSAVQIVRRRYRFLPG